MNKTHIVVILAAVVACTAWAASWTKSTSNRDQYPTAVACSADGRTVYLVVHWQSAGANASGRLLKSVDGGATWLEIEGKE